MILRIAGLYPVRFCIRASPWGYGPICIDSTSSRRSGSNALLTKAPYFDRWHGTLTFTFGLASRGDGVRFGVSVAQNFQELDEIGLMLSVEVEIADLTIG